jgi:hypothetical protein
VRECVTLTEDQWTAVDAGELCLLGEEAVTTGLAQEVADFLPPPGTQIFRFFVDLSTAI